ncbi:MAG: biotin--[acetyl-CoA-carboxylase] ligase [Desulfobacterales bacterium]|nr:biotin--[acetyl-CoA-carboxylase] ligase [Desulfobacterales bacterium]
MSKEDKEKILGDDEDHLQPEVVKKGLGSSVFAKNVIYHESLESTNTLAKDLAIQGCPEGTVVLTEEQTQGRGRRGRTWLSPGRENLLFSVVLRPTMDPERVFVLTMILALAAVDGVNAVCGLTPGIKWPNDLYLKGKKLAGILTEFSTKGGCVDYVVLGLGLNANWNPAGQEGISNPATSLLAASGRRTDRNELLIRILGFLDVYYRDVLSGRIDSFHRRWNDLSMILGREIAVESEGERIYGRAVRIDEVGALIIEDKGRRERRIINGEVSVRLRGS